jgi:hypothetical protein
MRRDKVPGRLEINRGLDDLLEFVDPPGVVGAPGVAGGPASRLHCWQQERDQHSDDRDSDQELDQGETTATRDGSPARINRPFRTGPCLGHRITLIGCTVLAEHRIPPSRRRSVKRE